MYTQLVVGLAIVVAAPAPKEAPKKALSIVGEWQAEKLSVEGTDVPVPDNFAFGYRFQDDGVMFSMVNGKQSPKSGTFAIDATKSPAHLDLIPNEGKKMPVKLIFKMDGEKLIICGVKNSGDRPSDFTTPAANKFIITMKRIK